MNKDVRNKILNKVEGLSFEDILKICENTWQVPNKITIREHG